MSPPKSHRTILVQLRLGRASDYKPTLFPLMRDTTTLEEGGVYLEYALDEIINMREMVKKRPSYRSAYENVKRQYDVYVPSLRWQVI